MSGPARDTKTERLAVFFSDLVDRPSVLPEILKFFEQGEPDEAQKLLDAAEGGK